MTRKMTFSATENQRSYENTTL